MRKIFATPPIEFIASVKAFKLGKDPLTSSKIIQFIRVENYAPKRKVATGESDFVRLVFQDIIPALHCRYLLSRAKSYIDLEQEFTLREHQDNLLWVLLLMVQTARRHAYTWIADSRDKSQQVIGNPQEIHDLQRLAS